MVKSVNSLVFYPKTVLSVLLFSANLAIEEDERVTHYVAFRCRKAINVLLSVVEKILYVQLENYQVVYPSLLWSILRIALNQTTLA